MSFKKLINFFFLFDVVFFENISYEVVFNAQYMF